jgi:hypothetical protein
MRRPVVPLAAELRVNAEQINVWSEDVELEDQILIREVCSGCCIFVSRSDYRMSGSRRAARLTRSVSTTDGTARAAFRAIGSAQKRDLLVNPSFKVVIN